MRLSILPTLIVLLLVGLVVLMPGRDASLPGPGSGLVLPGSAAAGSDVALVLAQLPRLELRDPPAWAQSRGVDEVARHLDRLEWGGHGVLVSSRQALGRVGDAVADQVLARLEDLGGKDPILSAKLVTLLGDDPEPDERVVEELIRYAFSDSDLVARAALKVLAYCPAEAAVGGVVGRLHDADPQVRATARGALGERVRGGDPVARDYLLRELESNPATPDLAFVTVLGECEPDERGMEVLAAIADRAPQVESMAALACLLVHEDPLARERVRAMIAEGDLTAQVNGLRMAAMSGHVLFPELWTGIVVSKQRQVVLALLPSLVRAVREGTDEALLAVQLLEQMALDPTHPVQQECLAELYVDEHAFAIERTRLELEQAVGAYLGVTVDRISRGPPGLVDRYLPVALARLDDPRTGIPEHLVLSRLIAQVAPEAAAPRLVEDVLEGPEEWTPAVLPMLAGTGVHGLAALAPHLRDPRAAGVLVYCASVNRLPAALPLLEGVALDPDMDEALRVHALDAMVRLEAGPREDVLRRVALERGDPALSERARLLFWNYL